jgi:hypothetical protein
LITEIELPEVVVPPGVVTMIGPVKLIMAGIVKTIWVLVALMMVAVTSLMVTVISERVVGKLAPVIVTVVPGGPLTGVKLVIVGGGLLPPPGLISHLEDKM